MIADVVSLVFRLYSLLVLARVLLSWLNANPYRPVVNHPLVRVLNQATEPVLAPVRRLIPPLGGTIDISPAVALILIEIARTLLVAILVRL